MSAYTKIRVAVVGLAVLMILSSPVLGQGAATGIRISNVVTTSPDVSFDVTVNTILPWDSYYYTGFLGNNMSYFTTWSTSTTGTTTGGGTGTSSSSGWLWGASQMATPVVNAIEFGDGSTITATTIPAVNPGVPGAYVGSFSHSYGAAGNYTIRAGTPFPNTGVITTGNPVIVPASSPISVNISSSSYIRTHTLSSYTFTSFFAGSYLSAFTSPYPITMGLTNTATVIIDAVPLIEIPTMSSLGLFMLMIVIAFAGVALLRK